MSVLQFILNCTLCAMFMHIAAGEHIAQRYCVEFIVVGLDSDDDARHQALQLSSFTPLLAIIPFCSHFIYSTINTTFYTIHIKASSGIA